MTPHEEAELLLHYLKSNKAVYEGRPIGDSLYDATEGNAIDFVHEKCIATRFVVPAKKGESFQNPSFTFWISYPLGLLGESGRPCLLEDIAAPLESTAEGSCSSAYTIFSALFAATKTRFMQPHSEKATQGSALPIPSLRFTSCSFPNPEKLRLYTE